MIVSFSAEQLRHIANQLDAYSAIVQAGGGNLPSNTPIKIDGENVAYLKWFQDGEQYLAEILSFTPGDAVPLYYNEGMEDPQLDGETLERQGTVHRCASQQPHGVHHCLGWYCEPRHKAEDSVAWASEESVNHPNSTYVTEGHTHHCTSDHERRNSHECNGTTCVPPHDRLGSVTWQ